MSSGFYMSSRFVEMTKFWRAVMLGEELTQPVITGNSFEIIYAHENVHLTHYRG